MLFGCGPRFEVAVMRVVKTDLASGVPSGAGRMPAVPGGRCLFDNLSEIGIVVLGFGSLTL